MWIVITVVIGFLAGLVARLLMPGRDPGGFIVTTLLGIGGAFLATWIGQHLRWYAPGQSTGFIGAVLGAILILILYRLLRRAGR
jgi:uncharacterized membrane protein YeaQ/YmgE (transglycosylase-associated protein family)